MPRLILCALLLGSPLLSSPALACPDCDSTLAARAAVFGEGFWLQLLMLAPLPLTLVALCVFLYRLYKPTTPLRLVSPSRGARHRGALIAAGAALGIGLGAFLDGIVLHQLLQWHGMFTSKVEPTDLVAAKYNMLWDGIFHALAWSATAAGVALLWHASPTKLLPNANRALIGALALGWGAFNLVEGVLNHHLYGLHHVRPGPDQLAWDLGFLLVSALLAAFGARLVVPKQTIADGGGTTAPDRARISGAFERASEHALPQRGQP